jgi:hypothetical protein
MKIKKDPKRFIQQGVEKEGVIPFDPNDPEQVQSLAELQERYGIIKKGEYPVGVKKPSTLISPPKFE